MYYNITNAINGVLGNDQDPDSSLTATLVAGPSFASGFVLKSVTAPFHTLMMVRQTTQIVSPTRQMTEVIHQIRQQLLLI